jgi:DNA (cytosine-5)-methyltransferase 1
MAPQSIHETVVHLGTQRGYPRYFVNTRYLARAGFSEGQWLSIRISDESLTIRPTEEPSGKRVQEKDGRPLIDLNAKFLAEVFGDTRTLHVRVSEKEITLSIHPLDQKSRERPSDGSMGSLFAGAGLLDQAGVEAGYRAKWAVEIDRATADTYADNHPGATVYEMSVHEAAFAESLTPVELLVLGLPCQPWARCRTLNADGSKVDRTRPATEHPLGDMAFWTFLIVARANPRKVVLECAPGFKDRELWASLTGALKRLGYDVDSRVLNANAYGAVSKRTRTVLVATTPSSKCAAFKWPEPFPAGAPRCTVGNLLDKDLPDELWWDRTSKPWVFRVNEANAARGSGFGFQVVHPEDTEIGTLTSEYGETKNDQPILAHPTKPETYRYFTISEGRRFFGLPDSYSLPEAKTRAWRLLGQAVYIPLFTAIIKATREAAAALATAGTGDLPLFSQNAG